jgi:uncharacterized sulfatase
MGSEIGFGRLTRSVVPRLRLRVKRTALNVEQYLSNKLDLREDAMRLMQLLLTALSFSLATPNLATAADRPNILWITSEDNGPHLGCYGDAFATTPNLDRLATRGVIYRHAWSNGPVCAPARTAIISGMYPPSTGSEHMRSMVRLPAGMKMYPQFLREAGYYCTNNSKEDYNLEKPGRVWDDSSARAHWKNRAAGQPFFAVFNVTVTHESQIRARPHRAVHDAAKVRVPAYHPDTPEVRQDWAQYYDKMTEMDAIAGRHLQELTDAGLADDTIIFYYGDHGPGMPRSKRWPYNSGLHVPLIVVIPPKFQHLAPADYKLGGESKRLVSFVDLAPTLLSLAGIKSPEYMQGHAFLGEHAAPPQPHAFGFRGRMDERYDLVRSVHDGRYVYIRNYMPHLPYGQHVAYMFQTPTTRVWKQSYDAGKLGPPRTHFWEPKPPEELYDLENDSDEVHNLASSDAHREVLERMRRAQRKLALRVRDVGFLPEDEIHSRSRGSTPYELGHDETRYPLERILDVAEQASLGRPESLPVLLRALGDSDSAVRYWATMGILMRGRETVLRTRGELVVRLHDDAPSVRIVAARALGQFGDDADAKRSRNVLVELASLDNNAPYVVWQSLNALDAVARNVGLSADVIRSLPTDHPSLEPRTKEYAARLIEKILADLQ